MGDADDSELSYDLHSPAGGSFDAPSGQIGLTDGTAVLSVQYTAPTVAGPAPIIIRVVDAGGLAASFSFTLSIQDEPIDPDPTQVTAVVNFPPVIESTSDTALSMAVVGKYLFVMDRVAGSATYSTFDRGTGVRAATASPGYYYISQYLGVARSLSRVFHFRDGVSPNDIHRVDVNQTNGQLSNIGESPYHGGYSFTAPIRFFPDDTKVVVASGAIFSTADLTTAGSFGRTYVDMGFHGPYAHLISKSGVRTEVNVYDTNLAVQAVRYYEGEPLRLFIHQNTFVLITKQADRIIGVQIKALPLE